MHARGNVEVWLGDLLVMQQKSLHAVIREAYQMINDQAFDLLAFFNDYIAQVCSLNYIPASIFVSWHLPITGSASCLIKE